MSNLTTLSRSDTVTRAIAAGKQQAKTQPLKGGHNKDDESVQSTKPDVTIDPMPAAETKIDTSIFDVFTDFELDLSCLSPPASPSPSTSELPPSTPSPGPSPPTSPSPILSRTISYASQLTLPSSKKKTSKKVSSPQLSSTVPAGSRGSWPVIKYAGRGTPIDRSRRLEWGGFVDGDVGEDGVLFSAVRSTSLDSAVRPSVRSLSPIEAEWNHRESNSMPSSAYARSVSQRTASTYEQAPELAPIQIEGLGKDKSEDWDTIMKTVLSPTEETPEPPENGTPNLKDGKSETGLPIASAHEAERTVDMPEVITQVEMMSPEQIEQLNNGLEMDLGLNAALDLGLGKRGGMNWFDLGLLPGSRAGSRAASGRESPSVYSSHEERSTHTGQRHADPDVDADSESPPSASAHDPSEHRSNTSTKADHANGLAGNDVKQPTPPQRQHQNQQHWWSKILLRLRRVHTIIAVHKSRL